MSDFVKIFFFTGCINVLTSYPDFRRNFNRTAGFFHHFPVERLNLRFPGFNPPTREEEPVFIFYSQQPSGFIKYNGISRGTFSIYRAIPGLIQKYYGFERETGEVTGIYLWDSEQSLREYRQSELARTIAEAYRTEGQPRIEVFEVPLVLRS